MSEDMSNKGPAKPEWNDVWGDAPADTANQPSPSEVENDFVQSGVIAYRNPSNTQSPMSLSCARTVLSLSVVPTVVGLSILFGYWMTAWDWFVQAGFVWLGIGGAATFVLGVISLVNAIRANSRQPKDKVAFHYGYGVSAAILSVLAAGFCVIFGAHLVESPHTHVKITNATQSAIDRIVVHFDSGSISAGPLAPGTDSETGLKWLSHDGPLHVTVTVGGQSRKKIDRQGVNKTTLSTDPFTIIIEPVELPNAVATTSTSN